MPVFENENSNEQARPLNIWIYTQSFKFTEQHFLAFLSMQTLLFVNDQIKK